MGLSDLDPHKMLNWKLHWIYCSLTQHPEMPLLTKGEIEARLATAEEAFTQLVSELGTMLDEYASNIVPILQGLPAYAKIRMSAETLLHRLQTLQEQEFDQARQTLQARKQRTLRIFPEAPEPFEPMKRNGS